MPDQRRSSLEIHDRSFTKRTYFHPPSQKRGRAQHRRTHDRPRPPASLTPPCSRAQPARPSAETR
eukprot:1884194-Prymnesium_polylepis.1